MITMMVSVEIFFWYELQEKSSFDEYFSLYIIWIFIYGLVKLCK